jgi:hypothetical protein
MRLTCLNWRLQCSVFVDYARQTWRYNMPLHCWWYNPSVVNAVSRKIWYIYGEAWQISHVPQT